MNYSNILISIISIIIVPFLSVYIYKKQKNNNDNNVLYILFLYARSIAFVFLVTKLIYQIICAFTGFENNIYSYQYCLLSLFVSILLPYFILFIEKKVKLEIKIENNENKE